MKIHIVRYLPLSCYFFLRRPKCLPQHLFLNTFSLYCSFTLRDQVLHPYKTTGKIIVPYILIVIFLDGKW